MIWCIVCCLLESSDNPPESPHNTPIPDCLTSSSELLDPVPIFPRFVGVLTSSFRLRMSEGTDPNLLQLRSQARRMSSPSILLESCWVDEVPEEENEPSSEECETLGIDLKDL